LSLKDTIRVIQSNKRRVKIFVDFWNVVINARKQAKKFDLEIKWNALSDLVVSHTRLGYSDESGAELAGCYIFGSYSQSNPEEANFVKKVIDEYGSLPGLFFNFTERVQKKTSVKCSDCGLPNRVSSEAGVDVLLAVEMIKHSAMREHEYMALISSDRDFTPVLSYLKDQGQRILHVGTSSADREMRSISWSQIDLTDHYPYLCKINADNYMILSAPDCETELAELKAAAPVSENKISIIDITDKEQISDNDLNFLMSHLGLYWKKYGAEDSRIHESHKKFDNIFTFRKSLLEKKIYGNLPYVLRNGNSEIYFNHNDSRFRWLKMSGDGTAERWEKLS